MLSIIPGIKVINDKTEEFEYFSLGDNVEIKTYSQKRFAGVLLYMDLSQGTHPDNLVIEIGNESISIPVDDVKSIKTLN